jgi:hypothetical protein
MTDLPRQLQMLFATVPPRAGDDVSAQLEAYAVAIDGHDLRDIDAAIRRLLRGEVAGHNPSFAPSAALLGKVVGQCMTDRLDSERRARKPALPPPAIERSPESIARVRALTEKAVRQLGRTMRTDDARKASARAGRRRAHARAGRPTMNPH